eukprot:3845938-Pyramimonas_sp.AAC.1
MGAPKADYIPKLTSLFSTSWGNPGGFLGRLRLPEGRNKQMPTSFKNRATTMILASSGPPSGPVGGLMGRLRDLLGVSWAVLESSWAFLMVSSVDLESTSTILGELGGHLGPPWSSWRPS